MMMTCTVEREICKSQYPTPDSLWNVLLAYATWKTYEMSLYC